MGKYPKIAEWIEMDGYVRVLIILNEDSDSAFIRVYPEDSNGDKSSLDTLVEAYRSQYPNLESNEPLG